MSIKMKNKDKVILVHGVFQNSFFGEIKKRKCRNVFVMEGRPSLKAARSNCRGLQKVKLIPTVMADNMAGFLFYNALVQEVWLSYCVKDQTSALCDVGASILSILAKRHSVDVTLYPGPAPARMLGTQKEITSFMGQGVAPKNIRGYVPLYEWISLKKVRKIYD